MNHIKPDTDVNAPYAPIPIYNGEADILSYVIADVPTVARRIDASFSLLLDMQTRQPVGFQLEGFGGLR